MSAPTLATTTAQHGENIVIANIFDRIGTTNRQCVEFGAYDLRHASNVFPLWAHEGWSALLIEGDPVRAEAMRREYERESWSGTSVRIINSLVTPRGAASIDALLASNGFESTPDLMVIDVDGDDYYIWREMHARPRLVIIEFNPTVPTHLALVQEEGARRGFGASALALLQLGQAKGYSLVACTLGNAFFVETHYAAHFEHVNDLDRLFDPRALTYFMQSYDGGIVLSKAPYYTGNLFAAPPRIVGAGAHALRHELRRAYVLTRGGYEVLRALSAETADWMLDRFWRVRTRLGAHWFEKERER